MELIDLLSKVDELNCEIAAVRPLKPENEMRILAKFRLDWNYHSNAIEGNKLTLGETKAFLLEGLTAEGKPLKDHLDIRGHDEVIAYLTDFIQRKEVLTETVIRGLHKILLHEPYKVNARTLQGGTVSKWVKLGEYKTEPNFVITATGATKQFTSPHDTPARMQELMEWFQKTSADKSGHPIIVATMFHNQFTQIHPFDDGNGRMARVLLNLILMQNGFLPVVIKIGERDKYISALVKADAGEPNEMVKLVAENEIHSQELYLKGAKGEDVSDYDDVDKRLALLKQELRHKEKPAELNLEVQTGFISDFLRPLLERLVKKMHQFDELFANSRVHISGQYAPPGATRAQFQWTAEESISLEQKMQSMLLHIKQGNLFFNLIVSFQWESFQRAGLNTFGYSLQLQFHFEKYQYRMLAMPIQGRAPFEANNVYQNVPTEDCIRSLLSGASEAFVNYIEDQVKRKG